MEKIAAPIDNKNLFEDPFEDEVFRDFDAAHDHRVKGVRHLVGRKTVDDERGVRARVESWTSSGSGATTA